MKKNETKITEKNLRSSDQQIKNLLEEILKWTRFQGWQNVKQVLNETLKSEREKSVYQLSDGRSTNEIAKITNVSSMTVYNYWQKWSKIGLMEPYEKYKGRYKRSFSLEDFGIDFPKIASSKHSSMGTEEDSVQGDDT